ncbi:helix-turn-helix domain-containing protein [Pseudomonadota bacterium]
MQTETTQTPQAARAALSPIELATRWGHSRQHIYDLMKEGLLKSFRSGRHHRIPISEIERFERGDV